MDGTQMIQNGYQEAPGWDPGTQKEIVCQGRRFFSRLGLMYFLGTLIIYGVQLAVLLILELIEPDMLNNANFSLAATMLPMYLIGMPAMILLIRTVPAQQPAQHKMSAGKWTLGVIMCYSVMYCSNLVGVFLTVLIGLLKGGAVENTLQEITDSVNPVIAAVFMVICAPLFEEYIFRKLLVDWAVRYGQGVVRLRHYAGTVFCLYLRKDRKIAVYRSDAYDREFYGRRGGARAAEPGGSGRDGGGADAAGRRGDDGGPYAGAAGTAAPYGLSVLPVRTGGRGDRSSDRIPQKVQDPALRDCPARGQKVFHGSAQCGDAAFYIVLGGHDHMAAVSIKRTERSGYVYF